MTFSYFDSFFYVILTDNAGSLFGGAHRKIQFQFFSNNIRLNRNWNSFNNCFFFDIRNFEAVAAVAVGCGVSSGVVGISFTDKLVTGNLNTIVLG